MRDMGPMLTEREKLKVSLDLAITTLRQIAEYQRDPTESLLGAFDNCKILARNAIKDIGDGVNL